VHETPQILLATLVTTTGLFFLLWLWSLALRDASIVDIFWGVGFVQIAWVAAWLSDGSPARRVLVALLVSLWGLRLAHHLFRRNWGHGEDFRYRRMRAHHGPRFWLVSLFTVFLLQAALMWIVSLPVQLAVAAREPSGLTLLDGLGTLVFAVGLAFEAVGDRQLARFRADPTNAGRVLDTGLWAWTRHPNYFGDAVVWWGLFLIALATPWGFVAAIGPALMTFLLMRVSGVTLLEKSLSKTRPGYRDYVQRTSAFFPRPPGRRKES
jgi:steroid 5-alpha reductase family enzyme